MRFHLAACVAALALAGCSGGEETTAPEPTTPAGGTVSEVAPATEPAAPGAQPPEAEGTPEPTPAPTPTPTATPTAAPAAAPAPAAPKVAAAAPPAAFARCVVCHSAVKGEPDKLGPNLFGVYGAKAAQGSFKFSDALKNSGLTFDEATLHKWLENPRALVPGNRMSFPGLKDQAKRQEIIDYLKQQR